MNAVFRPQFWRDLEDGVAYLNVKASFETTRRWHEEVMANVARVERQPGSEDPFMFLCFLVLHVHQIRSADFPSRSYLLWAREAGDLTKIVRT